MLLSMRKLAVVKRRVESAEFQKFPVVSLLDDIAVLHDENDIGFADGGEAVGDNETGSALHQTGKGFLNVH